MSFGGLRPTPGALKRAPGPHAVMGERSARFARYASQLFPFFSQQPSGISAYEFLSNFLCYWHELYYSRMFFCLPLSTDPLISY